MDLVNENILVFQFGVHDSCRATIKAIRQCGFIVAICNVFKPFPNLCDFHNYIIDFRVVLEVLTSFRSLTDDAVSPLS